MSFDDFFKTSIVMKKSQSCPDKCEFKGVTEIPAVWVPPAENNPFIGIIISRDPTTAFIPFYKEANGMNLTEWREYLFSTNAIPKWTFDKIALFNRKYMEGAFSDFEMNNFKDTLFNSVYWTHLHKCCTDKQKKDSLNFRQKNARLCADLWLKEEIESALSEDVRFIIALGKDVERWFERTGNEILKDSDTHLYNLPHPSGANNGSWFSKDEQAKRILKEKIRNLVLECQKRE